MNDSLPRFEHSLRQLLDKLQGWLDQALILLPNAVVALVVLALAGLIARWTRHPIRRALFKMTGNEPVSGILGRILSLAVIAIGAIVALGVLQLDRTVASLLAGAGVIGIALAFAFQDIAANWMAGIYMSFRQPFTHGDLLETNGVLGTVQTIDLRITELETLTGQRVLIPNRKIFEDLMINYNRAPFRRVDVPVGVSYAEDLDRVARVTQEAVETVPGRDESRPVQVVYTAFGDSSIDLEARFWIPFQHSADFQSARSEAVRRIKAAYGREGITIPFPIRTLDFGIKGGSRLREQLEKPVD